MRKARIWEIRAPGSGILRCLTLTEFHLKLQVCQVRWLKSLTLRFTAILLSLSTEAMWRAVFFCLDPSGWPESGHTDADAHRGAHRAEDRHYLPTQTETWTFGTDTKGCRWNSSSNHQSSYNREGKVLSGLFGSPLGCSHPFQCSAAKNCLWTKHILANTLLLVRFEFP